MENRFRTTDISAGKFVEFVTRVNNNGCKGSVPVYEVLLKFADSAGNEILYCKKL